MPSKTTTALAILLVFGSGSAALADTNNRTSHHGSVARRAVPVTMPNGRNRTVDHAVKPFTAEEKGWFDRASRSSEHFLAAACANPELS
jgi:hypothetical protein